MNRNQRKRRARKRPLTSPQRTSRWSVTPWITTTVKVDRPLTEADKREGFIRATGGFARAEQRWAERAARGMTDAGPAAALACELGIFGGSSGPNSLSLVYQGAGLKIWISWTIQNHVTARPTFEEQTHHRYGAACVRNQGPGGYSARLVLSIASA